MIYVVPNTQGEVCKICGRKEGEMLSDSIPVSLPPKGTGLQTEIHLVCVPCVERAIEVLLLAQVKDKS